MGHINLLNIVVNDNVVCFEFNYSSDLECYFSGKQFVIEYPVKIDSVPVSILCIPFLANLLGLVWLTDSTINISELDKDFFECLPKLKNAFHLMYPDANFLGTINVNTVVNNNFSTNSKSAMFYSGGVDSTQTLITHFNEDIDLISIWGSDINYENEDGWNILNGSIKNTISNLGKRYYTIRSSFREFDNEWEAHKKFFSILGDGWWHGIKHGLALLSHVAPLAYLYGYSSFYIASTHSFKNKNVKCGSHPSIDNCVKFCGCQVFHDGFEFTRQDKIRNIVEYVNGGNKIKLHVCWVTQHGDNCCKCEKCARTIYAILIEGGNPEKMGFVNYQDVFRYFNKKQCLDCLRHNKHLVCEWESIGEYFKQNSRFLKNKSYWKNIKWISTFDSKNEKLFKSSTLRKRVKNFSRRVVRKANSLYNSLLFALRTKTDRENTVLLIGTPYHDNIGDAAIAEAELIFLKNNGFNVIEFNTNDWVHYKKIICRKAKNKVVFLHGGGNFGDLWPNEEKIRQDILKCIKAKSIVLMPQTCFFKDDRNSLLDGFKLYNCQNVHLFAREKYSFNKMRELFNNANTYLTPDIVLYLFNLYSRQTNEPNKKDIDVLLVLRSDCESALSFYDKIIIEKILNANRITYKKSDMNYPSRIDIKQRAKIVESKIDEFSKAKIVITDRLHGMIFSYIANVPCIVLNNNNYKIRGVFEWIKDISNCVFIDDVYSLEKEIKNSVVKNGNKAIDLALFDDLRLITSKLK